MNGNQQEATMQKADVVKGIAELMKVWNIIEQRVKAAYPGASAEKVYCLTADAMTRQLAYGK